MKSEPQTRCSAARGFNECINFWLGLSLTAKCEGVSLDSVDLGSKKDGVVFDFIRGVTSGKRRKIEPRS